MFNNNNQYARPFILKIKVPLSLLMTLSFLVGCAPQYHDFSEVEWMPIHEVFQEAYNKYWESMDQQATLYSPLSRDEFTSLADEQMPESESHYYLSSSQGLLFKRPMPTFSSLHISDLKVRVYFSAEKIGTTLPDGTIRITSSIGDNHHEYDRMIPYHGYTAPPMNVCTSNLITCTINGNRGLLVKDYEMNYLQYRKADDGSYEWSIDMLYLGIDGLALGFYYIKLDEIYVKVVSNIVMPYD
jgi:hypothetical protein